MANLAKLVKQAQEMQAKVAKLEEELARQEFEASSGGGMVTVRMNGRQEVLKVTISDEVISAGDREMIEDLVAAAFNEARRQAADAARARMASLTGGLGLPGLF